MIAVVLALALAQAPAASTFDDGAIIGRVCDDLDDDGVCAPSEPGLAGQAVMLETGLVSMTDAAGRFHLAAVPGRALEAANDGRLALGRHRLGIDPRDLPVGSRIRPPGVTLEVPAGALVTQDFAIHRAATVLPPLSLRGVPRLRIRSHGVAWSNEVEVPPGARVCSRALCSETQLSAELEWGHQELPISLRLATGVVVLAVLPIDLVRREASVLVIPQQIQLLGGMWVDAHKILHNETSVEVGVATQTVAPHSNLALGDTAESIDVTVMPRRSGAWHEQVSRMATQGASAVGLLDLEASFDFKTGQFHVAGRGAASGRARVLGFDLSAVIDVSDADVALVAGGQAAALLQPRALDTFQRQLELSRVVAPQFGDDAATLATNPSMNRFRIEVARDGWGRLGYGSERVFFSDSEVGRAYRAADGAYVHLETPTQATPFGLELRGLVAPPQSDAVSGLARRPAHERFESTGGSLFFLAHQSVVQGSEVVRIEWRESVSGVVRREQTLKRLEHYSVDTLSGRVLLARPLSLIEGGSLLQTDPLSAGVMPVLVVDYEYLSLEAASAVAGGELRGRAGPVTLGVGALQDNGYQLLRGRAHALLGPVDLSLEAAHSRGPLEGLAYSTDGGLTHALWLDHPSSEGWAATARARTAGLFGHGFWDASARLREAGFEDLGAVGALKQLSLRGEQPLGPVVVSLLADLRDAPDPREPFSKARVRGRLLGAGLGFEREEWGVRVEIRDIAQVFESSAGALQPERGAFSLGVAGRYRLTKWLQLRASYRQQLLEHGATGFNDTFAMAGADVSPVDWLTVGVRAGWGPQSGVLGWGLVSAKRGPETWYGAHSLDVDAPPGSERRLVTGVRQELSPSSSVFVEDVSATDIDGLRIGRAVGLTQRLSDSVSLMGRYERGARTADGVTPTAARDAGGVTFAYDAASLHMFARGEVRIERERLTQWLALAGGEVALHESVRASARLQFAHTALAGLLNQRSLDVVAGLSWRFQSGALLGRYTFHREWKSGNELIQHVISVLPAVRFGDRLALASGGHLAFGPLGTVASVSVRPSVRVVSGLELAVEGAVRSSNPDGGGLMALRGEAGFRFDSRFYVGAGYSLFGFSGTGLEAASSTASSRVYLRTEVAY